MSLSVDSLSNYYNSMADAKASANRANGATASIGNISANSSEEEMTEAVKSFESYMLEQVIKQVKKSVKSEEDDEDSAMSQYKDMYMDSTIQTLAADMVDQYGGKLTEDLVAQMKRNYGLE